MKKVYTITFHRANNYGAVLQAYALQNVLQKKYDTKILDYDCKTISEGYKLFAPVHHNFKKQIIQFAKDIINIKKNYNRNKKFNSFRDKLCLTKMYSKSDILNNYPKVDVYITGSDQVWNPQLTGGIDDVYTINFGSGEFKKISYAASVGSIESLRNLESDLINKIINIDSISVREKTLQDYLIEKTNKDIKLVLDPTLLLSREEWLMATSSERIIKEKYIFVYCGKEPDYFYDIVNELAKKTGYLILYSGRRDIENKYHYRKKSYYESGPSEFINLINNAEYVVTASFHGTALSAVLNTKMFAVLNNYSDRLTTLLEQLNLSDRIINNIDDFMMKFDNDIDWETTNNLLKEISESSVKWLYDTIDK